jgi:hypothetical protein
LRPRERSGHVLASEDASPALGEMLLAQGNASLAGGDWLLRMGPPQADEWQETAKHISGFR